MDNLIEYQNMLAIGTVTICALTIALSYVLCVERFFVFAELGAWEMLECFVISKPSGDTTLNELAELNPEHARWLRELTVRQRVNEPITFPDPSNEHDINPIPLSFVDTLLLLVSPKNDLYSQHGPITYFFSKG